MTDYKDDAKLPASDELAKLHKDLCDAQDELKDARVASNMARSRECNAVNAYNAACKAWEAATRLEPVKSYREAAEA